MSVKWAYWAFSYALFSRRASDDKTSKDLEIILYELGLDSWIYFLEYNLGSIYSEYETNIELEVADLG